MRLSLFVRAILASALLAPNAVHAQDTTLAGVRFERRDVMVPMRDGTRLFTVILVPRSSPTPPPVLMSRTPYGTDGWGGTENMAVAFKELIQDGYVFVFQDIRGQHASEGEFIMNRPARDARDPKAVDEATDTWDTIEWLLKNVPTNGRVGMLGISYPGFLVDAALLDPHPALKAMSPQAPMVDTWMGDDFFHQGAFRQSYAIEWIHGREAKLVGDPGPLKMTRWDTYDWYLGFPSLDSLARNTGAVKWPTWKRFVAHPAYDSVWQGRAIDRHLRHTSVPTLTVGGWWDQEDGYGPLASYRSLEATDTGHVNFLVVGPWFHGQWYDEPGDSLAAVRFGRPTGDDFRELQARWFAWWLKDKGDGTFPEATLFDAGTNTWRTFASWPAKGAVARNLYLQPKGGLSFDPPPADGGRDAWVSDPARPVPYRPRPIPSYVDWNIWLVRDQRFVDNRPDVMTWQTPPLDADITIAGDVTARLFASTTGSDADWVVKLIDVYPNGGTERAEMRGYELMVASDIMRGRYREGFDRPKAITPGAVLAYTVDLHQQAYTFRKGHRIMVQVQSTWFPLYDRNPQTFVPNIFTARPSDYRARTHAVHHAARYPSHVEVWVLEQP